MRRDARSVGRFRGAGRNPSGPLADRALRWRFWAEAVATFVAGVIAAVTFVAPDWAEELFGVEPDQGIGSFEVGVTFVAVLIAVACALAARHEWRWKGRLTQDQSGETDGGAA